MTLFNFRGAVYFWNNIIINNHKYIDPLVTNFFCKSWNCWRKTRNNFTYLVFITLANWKYCSQLMFTLNSNERKLLLIAQPFSIRSILQNLVKLWERFWNLIWFQKLFSIHSSLSLHSMYLLNQIQVYIENWFWPLFYGYFKPDWYAGMCVIFKKGLA